jgi:membrane dipeptidase
LDRRGFLKFSGGFAAAGLLPTVASPDARAQAQATMRFADMHSHVGMGFSRNAVFTADIREAMTRNGVVLISRKLLGDEPVITLTGNRIRAYRTARPGELWRSFENALDRAQERHRKERLEEVVSVESLDKVFQSGTPAIALAAEGADFLEGDIKRLEAVRSRGVVHVQLVHYRVSEVGDVSTEDYVHNGLTAFGRQVVAECNRLGILIDVAHGTSALIDQTLDLSSRPIIYSHGYVTDREPHPSQGPAQARGTYLPLARKMAQKGGVMGVFPLSFRYSSLNAYAEELLRTAEALGIAHVGVGTDMEGLPGSVIPTYDQFPVLAERLAKRGLKNEDIGNLMGGNFYRVLRQAMST